MRDYETRRALAERLRTRRHQIARAVTDDFLARHADWLDRYGDQARVRGQEDAEFHVDFLAGAVLADDPAAFRDYARWTVGVLGARGIEPRFLVENLEQVRGVATEGLDFEDRDLVDGIVGAAIEAIGSEPAAPATVDTEDPFRPERSLYLQAVRAGRRRAALTVVLEALEAGASIPRIYGKVLQPVQYEIGRLWERNEISVAEEHMATAITQYVVAQLYTRLEVPDSPRGAALVTGVSGELHQIGANMVADVLEADGWDVRFLGTQMPHHGVLEAIADQEPQLVGISATVLINLPAAADLIDSVRRRFGSDIAIISGGAAFRASGAAWREMGADAYGGDLDEAVRIADQLFPRTDR